MGGVAAGCVLARKGTGSGHGLNFPREANAYMREHHAILEWQVTLKAVNSCWHF
jgi:hypothetical protein